MRLTLRVISWLNEHAMDILAARWALATVAGCPLIVSWNFRHIVHFEKVPLYNAVNVLHRRMALEIRSPLEVIEDED